MIEHAQVVNSSGETFDQQVNMWIPTSCKNVESIIGFNFTEFTMRRSGIRFNVGIKDLLRFLAP